LLLPAPLRAALDEESERFPFRDLAAAAGALSRSYRGSPASPQRPFTSIEALAYALTRMPATYAAARFVFSKISSQPRVVLDIGAGAGAIAWAAAAQWTNLERIICLERDAEMAAWARTLLRRATFPIPFEFLTADAVTLRPMPSCDIAVFSYSLGEFPAPHRAPGIVAAFRAASHAVVVLEPGSQAGFAVLRDARATLINQGAAIAAPCPHSSACPMPSGDWCHFAARLERGALLRRLKASRLSYEDEKFSYTVATRQAPTPDDAVVIRRPVQRPGLIELSLCTPAGLTQIRVRKRDPLWHAARHASWGGPWPG
jgi:ribosomal protein RSM22 (predicted rRNA methylase)